MQVVTTIRTIRSSSVVVAHEWLAALFSSSQPVAPADAPNVGAPLPRFSWEINILSSFRGGSLEFLPPSSHTRAIGLPGKVNCRVTTKSDI
jgi:hypothetical protein